MHLLLLTVSFAIPTWTAVISPDIPSPGWGNPDSFCSNVYHREGLICESNPDSSSSQSCSAGSEHLSHASQALWGCSQDEIVFWRDRFIKWSQPVKAFTESAKERSNCWSMLNSFQGTLDDQVGRKVGRFLDKSEVCTGKELANLLNAETAVALVKLYSFIPGCQGLHFSRLAPDSGFLHNPDVLRLLEPHARLVEVFAIYKLDLALFKIHTEDYLVQFNAVMGFLTTVVESVTEENPEGLPDGWNGNEGVDFLVWILSVLTGSPVMPASRRGFNNKLLEGGGKIFKVGEAPSRLPACTDEHFIESISELKKRHFQGTGEAEVIQFILRRAIIGDAAPKDPIMDHIPNRPTYVRQALIKTVRALIHEVNDQIVNAHRVEAGVIHTQGGVMPCLGTSVLLMDRLNLWDPLQGEAGTVGNSSLAIVVELYGQSAPKAAIIRTREDARERAQALVIAVRNILISSGLRIN